jgi:hypothetical protein
MVTLPTNQISPFEHLPVFRARGTLTTTRGTLTTLPLLFALAATLLTGCRKPEVEKQAPAAASGEPGSRDPVVEVKKKAPPAALGHRVAIGPSLIVVPGRGLGAIRFGATVETVERHMAAPCDLKTESRCLYVRHAVDFTLKEGVVVGMKAEMRDRPVKNGPTSGDKAFGSFNGAVPPEIMMGLHRHVVIEEFGEPDKKEPVESPPELGLVDRHFYDGLIFEYDKIQNGSVVLAAIQVIPSKTAPPSGPKNAQAASEGEKTDVKTGAASGSSPVDKKLAGQK